MSTDATWRQILRPACRASGTGFRKPASVTLECAILEPLGLEPFGWSGGAASLALTIGPTGFVVGGLRQQFGYDLAVHICQASIDAIVSNG